MILCEVYWLDNKPSIEYKLKIVAIMEKVMKLDQVLAFVYIVETQSFSAAAEQMNVTTSAISKKINQLEDKSKILLMKQNTRGFELTEAGQLFYQQCCELVNAYKQAEATLMAAESTIKGELTVHATEYLAKVMLLPYLGEFLAQYPSLQLNLAINDRIADFNREKIDIFWGISEAGPENTKQRKISTSRQMLVATPFYLEKMGMPQKAQDLTRYNCIEHLNRPQKYQTIHFDNGDRVTLTPSLQLNSTIDMLSMVKAGVGFANLMHYEVADDLACGALVQLLFELRQPEMPVFLYYRNTRITNAKVRCFIDFFLNKPKPCLLT